MYRDGLGRPVDLEKATALFLESANAGHRSSQYALGRHYFDTQEYSAAIFWYQKSADQGDADAAYNLGYMYNEGMGTPRDLARANDLFLKSGMIAKFDGERNGRKAFDMLGTNYRYGLGVRRDRVEAYKWYCLADIAGHRDAR